MDWRQYRDSGGSRPAPPGNPAQSGVELNKLVTDGRDDDQLKQEIISKFRAIGMKL
jgi:hypothetical protein